MSCEKALRRGKSMLDYGLKTLCVESSTRDSNKKGIIHDMINGVSISNNSNHYR